MRKGIVIAGPTASGKSKIALKFAQQHPNAVIVNADSRQVFAKLKTLCAHPSEQDMKMAPHALYGYVDDAQKFSVHDWLNDVEKVLANDVFPIVVGGTGLYLQALLEGLPQLNMRDSDCQQPNEEVFEEFAVLKNEIASTVPDHLQYLESIKDVRRMKRVLEIHKTTALLPTQHKKINNIEVNWKIFFVDHDSLDERIHARLAGQIDEMIEEVRASKLSANSILNTAIGVEEIRRYLDQQIDKDALVELMRVRTRQYAKRQRTWFNKYLPKHQKISINTDFDLINEL